MTKETEWLVNLIPEGWRKRLEKEYTKGYFERLAHRVYSAYQFSGERKVLPALTDLFRALTLTPGAHVCILAQDPYINEGQADGLAFSVRDGVSLPPSLRNIYQELRTDIGVDRKTGNLEGLAKQGVLLLNTALTVQPFKSNSHADWGWDFFTDAIIESISHHESHVVFMLWGSNARSKKSLIAKQKHLILTAAHPSPYSAASGFFGCKHFSAANSYLRTHNREPINWLL